jgi:modulator of FtsH protease HflC
LPPARGPEVQVRPPRIRRARGECADAEQDPVLLIAAGGVILIARASVFTVSEGQLAIKSTGGEIVDAEFYARAAFQDSAGERGHQVRRRIITELYPSEHFLTREQEQLNVDFYVKWRIDNLRRYYETTGGTEDVANARCGETIKDSIKTVVTQRTLQQVVTAERTEFTDAMMKNARPVSRNSWASSWSTCASPRSTCRSRCRIRCSTACARPSRRRRRSCAPRAWRPRIARAPRRTSSRPRSSPMRPARPARSAARAMRSASEVYAKSYSKNAEFYSFYRSMQSYREAVGTQGDMLVIAPDSAYFKYFNKSQPQPQRSAPPYHGPSAGTNLRAIWAGAFALYLVLEGCCRSSIRRPRSA